MRRGCGNGEIWVLYAEGGAVMTVIGIIKRASLPSGKLPCVTCTVNYDQAPLRHMENSA